MSSTGVDDHLIAVNDALAKLELTQRELEAVIRRARADGLSWTAVGQLMGTTRQAAWERFSKRL